MKEVGLKILLIATILVSMSTMESCISQHNYPYSQLRYNGKRYNSLIVNRIPDYGDGHRDGCVIWPEMKLELRDLDQQTVGGLITDVEDKRPVLAQIRIVRKNGVSEILSTDSLGKFIFIKSSPVTKLYVTSRNYREMNIVTNKETLF